VNQAKQQAALALKRETSHSIREICQIVGISRNTYYKYTAQAPEQPASSRPPRRKAAPPEC
jgi:ACT domain-containing protein